MKRAQTVFINCISKQAPVIRKMSAFDIPRMVGQVLRLFARQIDKSDALELVFTVASDINALAITAEPNWIVSDFLASFGGQQSFLAARHIDEP